MRHIERAPLLVVGAIGLTFALVGADSCSGGRGGGGASTSTSTSSATAPAPQASSITGTIDPTSSIVGEPVTMTFDLSGFNQAIPDLSFDTSGDLHNQHTVDSVTISLDGGAPAACNEDPTSKPAYTCGSVAQGQKAEIVITAVPKDAGNLRPSVLWTTGAVGSDGWQEFIGDNSEVQFQETVNAA
jgi:hypothetical protein